jgi:hypothetical protein
MPLLARLREQWMLVVALLTALFWVVGQIEVYRDLPDRVSDHAESLDALDHRMLRIEARMDAPEACRRLLERTSPDVPSGRPVSEEDCAPRP